VLRETPQALLTWLRRIDATSDDFTFYPFHTGSTNHSVVSCHSSYSSDFGRGLVSFVCWYTDAACSCSVGSALGCSSDGALERGCGVLGRVYRGSSSVAPVVEGRLFHISSSMSSVSFSPAVKDSLELFSNCAAFCSSSCSSDCGKEH
jgi:hypothetical protein